MLDRVERRSVLVIGSGVAGLTTALGVEGATVITATPLGLGGSSDWAQGGVAVAWDPADTPAAHAADTITVSAGLAEEAVVRLLTEGGPERVQWLIDLGADFDRGTDGTLTLGREAGHAVRRIVHANGDSTGAELMRTLRTAVRVRPDIEEVDGSAVDLLVRSGRVVGAVVVETDGETVAYLAPAVVLATGGIGHVYSQTTNPPAVRGDGIAMAARVGARLVDMEFVQFHPTALAAGNDPMPLLTEALRGEGAVLIDGSGRRYMPDLHPDAELAPRDVVARANYRLMIQGRKPALDATAAVGDSFPDRFPTVFNFAMHNGIDPRREPMPVSPAAHYFMGGIDVDADGRSSLPGLWAVGEVSSTGVHGANRLASNSLLEGLVFGKRAADAVTADHQPLAEHLLFDVPARASSDRQDDGVVVYEAQHIRDRMWTNVGVERDADRLTDARDEMRSAARTARTSAARNLATVGGLIAEAALAREESRGGHFRVDFPRTGPGDAIRRTIVRRPVPTVSYAASADRLVPSQV